MSKYINAAELKLILNREHLNYSQMIEKKFVLKAIDEMPSADVVEVARCKDCKYWEYKCQGDGDCLYWQIEHCSDFYMETTGNHYCGFARERKETE